MKYGLAALLSAFAILPAQATLEASNPFRPGLIQPVSLSVAHPTPSFAAKGYWFIPQVKFMELRFTVTPGVEYIFIYVPR